MRERTENQASRYGLLDRLKALENDLCRLEGISDIDFDIDTYNPYDQIYHVVLIPKYFVDVRRDDYFNSRSRQLQAILDTCETHDLHPSGDRIEDMGEHWYIVRCAGKSWPRFSGTEAF